MSEPANLFPGNGLPVAGNRSLEQWLVWQQRIHTRAVELGLDRCRQVAARMGLLAPGYCVISVAGTNGKGSSVAVLEAVLGRAGYRTGAYYSPHLVRYNERIRVAGLEATDADLCRVFARVEEARCGTALTYFEFGTLAALQLFREAGVDVALLEVGLGGRLDAVNVLDADLALVTSVAMDHQEWLGDDREAIGREKAGIFRPGAPAVCSDPAPPASLVACARRLRAPLSILGRDFFCEKKEDGSGSWRWRGGGREYRGLPLSYPYGSCQVRNAAGALMALDRLAGRLPVPESAIVEGLKSCRLAGRCQVVPGPPPLLLDVAHNPQSALELRRSLADLPVSGATHMVVGMLRDKDHRAVFAELDRAADYWHVVGLPGWRGASAAALLAELRPVTDKPVRVYRHIWGALERLSHSASAADRAVVTGSFLTVGGALNWLNCGLGAGRAAWRGLDGGALASGALGGR